MRMHLAVRLDWVPVGASHLPNEPRTGRADWDILLIRAEDWLDGGRLSANVDQTVQNLVPDRTIIAVCPVPRRTPAARRLDRLLVRRLRNRTAAVILSPDEIIEGYAVSELLHPHSNQDESYYANTFYTALATEVVRALHARLRPLVKVVAVDADHTLWDGECAGAARDLRIGPGRAAFQHSLLRLRNNGVLLCLLSQNTHQDLADAFARHKFPLQLNDFTAVRAGWTAKPDKLASVATELDVAVDSFLFLDDNPGECAGMRQAWPSVLTVRFPQRDRQVTGFLRRLWAFDLVTSTTTDRNRAEMYRVEALRHQARAEAHDHTNFVRGLDLRITTRPVTQADVPRIAQLGERTTQFATGWPWSGQADLHALLSDRAIRCVAVCVTDRFGDYGLVGVVVHELRPDCMHVFAYLLSCRVLRRDVEYEVLRRLVDRAGTSRTARIVVPVTVTERNQPVRDFLDSVSARWTQTAEGGLLAEVPVPLVRVTPKRPAAPAEAVVRVSIGGGNGNELLAALAETLDTARRIHDYLFTDSDVGEQTTRSPAYGLWVSALKHIWESTLDVPDIAPEDDLFDRWGATSVDVLAADAQLRRMFGVSLTLRAALAVRTVRQQADVLLGGVVQPVPTIAGVRSGPGMPLLLLPPAGGLAYAYLELIRYLPDEHPVLLGQAPELNRAESALLDLPTLVDTYLTELAGIGGSGPLVLAGWSFGAILAHEAAVALQSRGTEVAALLLFDPPGAGQPYPGSTSRPDDVLAQFFDLLDPYRTDADSLATIHRAIFGGRPSPASSRGLAQTWDALLGQLLAHSTEAQRSRILIPELDQLGVLRAARVWKKNQRLTAEYVPRGRYRGPVRVFLVDHGPAQHVLSSVLPGSTNTNRYRVRPVGALSAHSAMMERENVRLFAHDVVDVLRPPHALP